MVGRTFKDGAEIDAHVFTQDVGGIVAHGLNICRLQGIEAKTRRDRLFARPPFQLVGTMATILPIARFPERDL